MSIAKPLFTWFLGMHGCWVRLADVGCVSVKDSRLGIYLGRPRKGATREPIRDGTRKGPPGESPGPACSGPRSLCLPLQFVTFQNVPRHVASIHTSPCGQPEAMLSSSQSKHVWDFIFSPSLFITPSICLNLPPPPS